MCPTPRAPRNKACRASAISVGRSHSSSISGGSPTVLAVAVIAAVISRPSPTRTAVGMLLVPLGLAIANYAILREGWMAQHRFATAVWPLAVLAVTLLAFHVLRGASTRRRLVAMTLATATAGLTVTGFWHHATAFRADLTVGIRAVAQNTGYWINGVRRHPRRCGTERCWRSMAVDRR